MKLLRLFALALLTATLTLSACGKKGDPVRPNEDTKKGEASRN